MPVTPKDVLTDPKFQAMSPEQKTQVLMRIDPNFAKLSLEQQQAVVGYQAPGPGPKKAGASVGDYLYEGAAGLGRAAKGALYDFPKAVLFPDNPLGIAGDLGKQLVGMLDAGSRSAESGEGRAGQTLSMMENAPLIGEMVKRVEKAGPGRFNLSPAAVGAATEGAGYMLAPEAVTRALPAGARILAQEMAGAGKEPVLQARIKYQQAMEEFNRASAEKKTEYAGKVAEARKAWVDKAMEARRGQAEATKHQGTRETLQKGQEAYADRLHDNLKQTFSTVKSRLDSRWNSLRSTPIRRGGTLTVLKDEPLNSKAIADSVDVAEKKFLQGSPESLRQFRDLMNWMREDAAGNPASIDTPGGLQPKLRPISWDEARTHYSALGDRMFSGDLPGNVQAAIRYVRDQGLGSELRSGAGRAGALPAYESLLYDWSRFENDWKNTSSVTMGGGSPLARAIKAPNGKTLAPQVLGKTGDLLIERLGRYTDAGGSPTTAAALRKLNAAEQAVPKMKPPEMPAPFKPPAEPKLGQPPTPPSPSAIRHGKLLEQASRGPAWYDFLFPPHGLEHLLLKRPGFREWVATQPRAETAIPDFVRQPTRSPSGPRPEPDVDFVTRRPGESAASSSLNQQRTAVDNLRMLYDRQKAAGDSQMYATASKLKDATDALRQAEMAQWGSAYAKGPQGGQPTGQGGGGANFDAAALEKMKADLQRRIDRGELK